MSWRPMPQPSSADPLPERPNFLKGSAVIAIAGCIVFAVSILIADVVVPDHDWVADTISDLGAGKYEFIVDVGIYAFSASLIACAVGAAHAHLGATGWTVGIYGLIVTGLIVFLIGARNEYGDNDNDGWVIHIYLVYVLGLTFAVMPWAMAAGAARVDRRLGTVCKGITIIWVLAAPVFLFLPTGVDGVYERGLGGITFVFVAALALTFWGRARALDTVED